MNTWMSTTPERYCKKHLEKQVETFTRFDWLDVDVPRQLFSPLFIEPEALQMLEFLL